MHMFALWLHIDETVYQVEIVYLASGGCESGHSQHPDHCSHFSIRAGWTQMVIK